MMLKIDPKSQRKNWPITFELFGQLSNAIDRFSFRETGETVIDRV